MNSASKGGEETQLAVPLGAKSSTPQKLNVLYMLCPNMPLEAHQPASGPRTRACLGLETEEALPLLASRAFVKMSCMLQDNLANGQGFLLSFRQHRKMIYLWRLTVARLVPSGQSASFPKAILQFISLYCAPTMARHLLTSRGLRR